MKRQSKQEADLDLSLLRILLAHLLLRLGRLHLTTLRAVLPLLAALPSLATSPTRALLSILKDAVNEVKSSSKSELITYRLRLRHH